MAKKSARGSEGMNPQEVLKEIEAFETAMIVGELSGGLASNSYLVNRDTEQFVLRLDTDVAAALGLDRKAEEKILKFISQNGLGPKPEFNDPDRGILITHYIEGRVWNKSDLHNAGKLQKLATILRQLHALKPIGQPFNLHDRITNYAQIIGTAEGYELADDTQRRMQEIEVQSQTQCLCHNDLICANIIEGQGVALIDWEYAAIGDPFFDLAIIVEHHGLDQVKSSVLLGAYFGELRDEDILRLNIFRSLYASLERLWLATIMALQGLKSE